MKKLIWTPALLLAMLPAVAQAPPGVLVWKAAELKGMTATLAPKVNAQKYATQNLATINGNNVLMVYRDGTGEAEYHENAGDFTIVQTGEGTFMLGGTIKDGKSTGPGEIRGPSIEGGKAYPVGPGDILNIPPKTPHQVILPPGQKITYFVLKTK